MNFNSIGTIADKNTLYGHTYFGGASLFKHDDLYYLFYTSYAPNTNSTIMCVATANNVKGPYTQTKQTVVDSVACPEASAGAFAFKAPGGKTYLYWYQTVKDTGNTIFGAEAEFENGVVKIKHETKKILITPSDSWEMKNEYGVGGKVCERPNVYFHNGYYYLFYAGSHWKTSYGQGYATSISPLGDFEKDKSNPILRSSSSIGGVGCTYVVPSPSGEELYVVYHAHKRVGVPSPRNVCIDKLIFIDNPNGPDHARILGPTVTPQAYT